VAKNWKNIKLLTPSSELEENNVIYMLTPLPKGFQTKYLKVF
jgi:hypothetical protein